jgi:hypothetical protein
MRAVTMFLDLRRVVQKLPRRSFSFNGCCDGSKACSAGQCLGMVRAREYVSRVGIAQVLCSRAGAELRLVLPVM